jgi:hypothetical protein
VIAKGEVPTFVYEDFIITPCTTFPPIIQTLSSEIEKIIKPQEFLAGIILPPEGGHKI